MLAGWFVRWWASSRRRWGYGVFVAIVVSSGPNVALHAADGDTECGGGGG